MYEKFMGKKPALFYFLVNIDYFSFVFFLEIFSASVFFKLTYLFNSNLSSPINVGLKK